MVAFQASRRGLDIDTMAAVLIEAVSHYWVLTDVFGSHPFEVDEDRYLSMLALMTAAALTGSPPSSDAIRTDAASGD